MADALKERAFLLASARDRHEARDPTRSLELDESSDRVLDISDGSRFSPLAPTGFALRVGAIP
jgi:hypothetical protein